MIIRFDLGTQYTESDQPDPQRHHASLKWTRVLIARSSSNSPYLRSTLAEEEGGRRRRRRPSPMATSKAPIFLALFLLLPALSFSFSPEKSSGGQRVLVLVDDLAITSSHSVFFASLKSRGFDLDFKLADDPKLALKRYGQYLYDGLVLFSPSAKRKWRKKKEDWFFVNVEVFFFLM